MPNVLILPPLKDAPFGIKRVIEAMHKHLPEHGWTIVDTEPEADIINLHAMTTIETNKPVVYSSHGLYWGEMDWPNDHYWANKVMIETMKRSHAITTPSKWVSHAITRGMLKSPKHIYHGVDPDRFRPQPSQGYVLWNKARADVVSNPQEMQKLASLMPDVGFVSTIGEKTPNVQILGIVPYERMSDIVAKAGVYLATARETFGIGTIEAMASGVPVAGWDHGGQREIIQDGITGYLAPHGDYQALADCVRKCLENRDELGNNARQDVIDRWRWEDKMEQYADTFSVTLEKSSLPRPKVSVIVTAHNLESYLSDCLESVYRQSFDNWECIIVDDDSSDNTPDVAKGFVDKDDRFRYVRTPHNLKLSGARNYGFTFSLGEYIIPLDADDMMEKRALEILSEFLDKDPHCHIAYGHLDIISDDGSNRRRNNWPFEEFNWFGQMAHLNQLPYCAMMRRDVLEASGGYRIRDWRAEDASFWCMVTSLGFTAKKATQSSTLIYRIRKNSKGATERNEGHSDGDWTSWYPWRLGATNAQEGANLQHKRPFAPLVPFGAQGNAPNYCWPVYSHHDPVVSVVIPCGPKHAHIVVDALDSIRAQTFPFWEAIVVNDTGRELNIDYAPWARVVDCGDHNIAMARNKGIEAARAPLVVFLDADDLLTPTALNDMLEAFLGANGARYIYTDWYSVMGSQIERKSAIEYNRDTEKGLTHSITAMIPREWCLAVGGFDKDLPGWEDWGFFLELAVNGYCGKRLNKALFVYRMHTGDRREQSLSDKDDTMPILRGRYSDYFTGRKQMAGCCGGNGDAILKAKGKLSLLSRAEPGEYEQMTTNDSGLVRIEYTGTRMGSITIKKANGEDLSRSYRLGNNTVNKYADATPADAKALVAAGHCRYVKAPGIDLKQAAVNIAPPPPVPEESIPQPVLEPEPEQEAFEIKDPSSMSVEKLRKYLAQNQSKLSKDDIKSILDMEIKGKNRIYAVKAIKFLLD